MRRPFFFGLLGAMAAGNLYLHLAASGDRDTRNLNLMEQATTDPPRSTSNNTRNLTTFGEAILPTIHNKEPACALLFFGLPRLFKSIPLPSIQKFVIATNPTCDIYAHSYNVTSMISKVDIEQVDIGELQLLTPNVILDTEQDFLQQHNHTLHEYYKHFPAHMK